LNTIMIALAIEVTVTSAAAGGLPATVF
jgi:hypothetical protein